MASSSASGPLDRSTVLVLDDDEILAEFVAVVLERQGATVRWAQDGETGLQTASDDPPDLVVSDWRMPRLNGLDVLRHLRSVTDAGPSSPSFVMMSAYHTPSLRQACTVAHADAYLQKPFTPKELLATVHDVLEH